MADVGDELGFRCIGALELLRSLENFRFQRSVASAQSPNPKPVCAKKQQGRRDSTRHEPWHRPPPWGQNGEGKRSLGTHYASLRDHPRMDGVMSISNGC